MRNQNPNRHAALLIALLLILAGCSLTGTEGDPYSAGRRPGRSRPGHGKSGPFCRRVLQCDPAADPALGLVVVRGEPRRLIAAAPLLREGHLIDKHSPRSRRETLFISPRGSAARCSPPW